MSEALQELAAHISLKRSDAVVSSEVVNGELTLTVAPNHIVALVEFLKIDTACHFSTLVDITAVKSSLRRCCKETSK